LGAGVPQWVCVGGGVWIWLPKCFAHPVIQNKEDSNVIVTAANHNRISGFDLEAGLNDVHSLEVEHNVIRCPSVDAKGSRIQRGVVVMGLKSEGEFTFSCNVLLGAHQPVPITLTHFPTRHEQKQKLPALPYVFPPDVGIEVRNFAQRMIVRFADNDASLYTAGLASYAFLPGAVTETIGRKNRVSKTSFVGFDLNCLDSARQMVTLEKNIGDDNVGQSFLVFAGQPYLPPPRTFMCAKLIENEVNNNTFFEPIAVATGNGGTLSAQVARNVTHKSTTFGIIVQTSLSLPTGDVLCISFEDNTSDTGFEFINNNSSGTTFQVDRLTGNNGGITTVGEITMVKEGTCRCGVSQCFFRVRMLDVDGFLSFSSILLRGK
jgi:hypothetical protein